MMADKKGCLWQKNGIEENLVKLWLHSQQSVLFSCSVALTRPFFEIGADGSAKWRVGECRVGKTPSPRLWRAAWRDKLARQKAKKTAKKRVAMLPDRTLSQAIAPYRTLNVVNREREGASRLGTFKTGQLCRSRTPKRVHPVNPV